jgi:hypothetical protein
MYYDLKNNIPLKKIEFDQYLSRYKVIKSPIKPGFCLYFVNCESGGNEFSKNFNIFDLS